MKTITLITVLLTAFIASSLVEARPRFNTNQFGTFVTGTKSATAKMYRPSREPSRSRYNYAPGYNTMNPSTTQNVRPANKYGW